MTTADACIEYGHAYLNELVDGATAPDTTRVEDAIEYYDSVTTLVVIDDTGHQPGIPRNDSFETERARLTREYINTFETKPDVVCYESEFTAGIREYMADVPTVSSDALTPELDVGAFYSLSSEGLYLYGGNGDSIDSARITDQRRGAKHTGYACGAYDAAMTLAKLGEITPPDSRILAKRSVSFHDASYIGCPPYQASELIREILVRSGLSSHSEDDVENIPVSVPTDTAQSTAEVHD